MSLEANRFFNKNNEGQDLSLRILQIVKKVVDEYDDEIKEDNTLDKVTLSKFKSVYNNFVYQLYRITRLFNDTFDDDNNYYLYTPELAAMIDGAIVTWNSVVLFLATSLDYKSLSKTNKSYIDNKFTQLAPAVLKVVNNLKNDLERGYAEVTSRNFPSDSLLGNLFELSSKLSKPDFSLINFKGDLKEGPEPRPGREPKEPEPEEEPEPEPEEPEEPEAEPEAEYIRESKIRKAIERYSKVNPKTSLMTQRAYEDISSFFRVPPSEDEYMAALRGIRPQSERARTDRNVAQASRDSQSEYYRTLVDLKRGLKRSLDLARETREILEN